MKKIFNYLFIFVCLFIFTNSVKAECTYNLVEETTKYTLSSGTSTGNSNVYYSSSATYFKGYETKFHIDENSSECHGIYPGQYLIDFYVYSENDFNDNLTANNFSSNFKNINITTGNLVANEIKSQLVDFYQTKYNGKNAYRILYKFTYDGDYANEFDFIINTSTNYFFENSSGIGGYGISYSNIYDYNTLIVDGFNDDKLKQAELDKQQETNDKLDDLHETIENCATNLFNINGTFVDSSGTNTLTISGSTFSFAGAGAGNGRYYIYQPMTLEKNTTYFVNFSNGFRFYIFDTSFNEIGTYFYDGGSKYFSFNTGNTSNVYFAFYAEGTKTTTYSNVTLYKSNSYVSKYGAYNEKVCVNKMDTQIDQNQTIIDQNNQTNNLIGGESDDITSKSCGMICKLKAVVNFINPLSEDFFAYKLVELMLNMLKSLFIPDDMDFVTNFVDALESKLGFIAAIPVKIIEFTMSLATATWSEFKSIQLPSISIFGYNFWNAQEIDLTEAINIFAPFKYVTDVICVVICAQTLNKWRERFTGGGAGK